MEKTSCQTSAADSTTNSEPSTKTTTTIETIDASRINHLLEFVRERLTTDIYGNFTLQGDRLAKDGRHTQLREVVQLVGLLEKVMTFVKRDEEVAATEAAQQARRAAKPNGIQATVMRDVVKGEVGKALRDVTIETGRLRDRLTKVEERAQKAEDDRAALQESIRKMSSGQLKGVRGAVKEKVGRSLRDTIVDQCKSIIAMEAQIRALEETLIKRLTVHQESIVRKVDARIFMAEKRVCNGVEQIGLRNKSASDVRTNARTEYNRYFCAPQGVFEVCYQVQCSQDPGADAKPEGDGGDEKGGCICQ